jgi:hypothetical protein
VALHILRVVKLVVRTHLGKVPRFGTGKGHRVSARVRDPADRVVSEGTTDLRNTEWNGTDRRFSEPNCHLLGEDATNTGVTHRD